MATSGRSLCEKYTSLTSDDIDIIEGYTERLGDIARAEKCDVFVDCPSMTGNSLVIVGEMKPFDRPSLYSTPLLGGFIKWENEPAVKRAFDSGLPVTNLIAVSMPENRNVMQSAFPILNGGKSIGILIYERLAPSNESDDDERYTLPRNRFLTNAEEGLLFDSLDEAVFYITWNEHICFRNRTAKHLLRNVGYVDDPLNMHVSNFWYSYNELGEREITNRIAGHSLCGRYVYIGSEQIKCALIIHDISERENALKERESISLSYSGYRHRVKNILQLVKGHYSQKAAKSDGELKRAYEEMAARLRSLQISMTRKGSEDGKVELRGMISEICEAIIDNEGGESCHVTLDIGGNTTYTSDENAALICEVITELMHNSLKYAFKGRTQGNVHITVSEVLLGKQILFEDDGIGFTPQDIRKESTGLQILESIVRERLSGDFSVESDKTGTRAKIEYIE